MQRKSALRHPQEYWTQPVYQVPMSDLSLVFESRPLQLIAHPKLESKQSSFRKADRHCPSHDDMVQHPNIHQRQRGLRVWVRYSSALDGSATPLGWLWARITPAAFSRSAALTTSRG